MDTPITISSTLSSVGKGPKKIKTPISDLNIERVPVSWDSPLKPCDRESSCTPTALQKVNNWINSLNRLNREHVESNSNSHRQSSDFSDAESQNGFNDERDLVSSMIAMSEYNRYKPKEKQIEDELDNYYTPYEYNDDRGSQSTSRTVVDTMYGGGPKKHFHPKAVKRRRSLPNRNLMSKYDDKSDDYDSDVPLSPESEKKKELCSYLQLMKPTDKKTVMILQNRRSVRVKNLSLMQEKRDLEKKLKGNNGSKHENNISIDIATEQCPGLKSFDEMKVDLDNERYKWLKYSGTQCSNYTFYFPKPANNLSETIRHFDDVTDYWFRKDKEDFNKMIHDSDNRIKEERGNTKKKISPIPQMNKIKIEDNDQHMTTLPAQIQIKRKKIGSVQNEYATISKDTREQTKTVTTKERNTPEFNNKTKTKTVTKRTRNDNSNVNKKDASYACASINNVKKAKQHLRSFSETKLSLMDEDVNNTDMTKPIDIKNHSPSRTKIQNSTEGKNIKNGNSVGATSIFTRARSLKKKTKLRKLNNERRLQGSSFKIKLKLKQKRKSSGLPSAVEGKLTRSRSPLLSDTRSLRNRNIDTPSTEINLLKSKTQEKKCLVNKKENIKQRVKQIMKRPKKSHVLLENRKKEISKVPLKDRDKNYLLSTDGKVNNGETILPFNKEHSTCVVLQKLIPDADLCKLNTALKTSLCTKNIDKTLPIIAIYDKNTGLESTHETTEKSQFYSQILNIEKNIAEDILNDNPKTDFYSEGTSQNKINRNKNFDLTNSKKDSIIHSIEVNNSELSNLTSTGCLTPTSSNQKRKVNSENIPKSRDTTSFTSNRKNSSGIKSLHKCLNILTPKSIPTNLEIVNSPTGWSSESLNHKQKKSQHSIHILKEHGAVLKAFYSEYNLVLCQEFMVSFWTQTALGNVLGAQNMWIHKGTIQRMAMNNKCIFKESLEMVVSSESNVAYIELWTKEHQSDKREGPVADVFATVYFWKKGQNGLDKKVLQLENINGFADDVQYSVLKSTPKIIVSWHLACSELENKKTHIHCYQLAADYQTVYNISDFEAVDHYVSSLHNIEGCDSLIMGCGENKITLWNIDHGYVMATIEMSEIKSPLSTLWVKCDRGFLFTLQQCVDRELRLIAIHGLNHSWKKLASYVPPDEYDRLKGVCVENGIVLAFYDQGILCWNAQTSETIVEESHNEAEYISGKYVISVVNDQVNIRHAITHLLSAEDL